MSPLPPQGWPRPSVDSGSEAAAASGGPLWSRRRLKALLWHQLSLQEMSGAVGDLGTLLPLLILLARQRCIYLGPALFWGGASNVLTGYIWNVPMCVQPMKAIAAVALAGSGGGDGGGLTQAQVTAAGISMGIIMTVLGVTNAMELVNRILPTMVVSGLQMGVGINLAIHGVHTVLLTTKDDGSSSSSSFIDSFESIFLTLALSLATLFWLRPSSSRPHPVGIYLFTIGLLLALIKPQASKQNPSEIPLSSSIIVWTLNGITSHDWWTGFSQGALPQLPLTTLNSVISVCALAQSLYAPSTTSMTTTTIRTGEIDEKEDYDDDDDDENVVVSRRQVAISVGLMNVFFCPLGAMPSCHGAGGLAGQHLMGARYGTSVIYLGLLKMMVATFLGGTLALTVLDALPPAVLGLLLFLAGQELAATGLTALTTTTATTMSARDHDSANTTKVRKWNVIAIMTTSVIVATKTHIGVLVGWIAHLVYGDGFTDFIAWARRRGTVPGPGRRRREQQRQQREETRTLMGSRNTTTVVFEKMQGNDDINTEMFVLDEDLFHATSATTADSTTTTTTSEFFFHQKDKVVPREGPKITII